LINKAVFLDRDGVINKDVGYLDDFKKFKLLPNVINAIKLLKKFNFKIVIITNQSGVARGYFSEEQLNKIHEKMLKIIEKKGGKIDEIYYCPHHPEFGNEKYKKKCSCRKPNIGLILKAKNELNIDLEQSFFIGDKITDIIAGNKAKCKTILISSKNEIISNNNLKDLKIDYIAKNLFSAVKWILNLKKEE